MDIGIRRFAMAEIYDFAFSRGQQFARKYSKILITRDLGEAIISQIKFVRWQHELTGPAKCVHVGNYMSAKINLLNYGVC